MNKRHLHHVWTKFRLIKPWYLLVILILSAVVCVYALRANNQRMLELRSAVYSADKDSTGVETALQGLQAYVTTHMNTNLSAGPDPVYPPIQLKYTYERLVKAQSDELAEASGAIYNNAQKYCEQQNSTGFSGSNRIPCIEKYIQDNGGQAATTIPDASYKFDFVTPAWSPDLAGWSLVAVVVSSVLFITSLISRLWFKKQLS